VKPASHKRRSVPPKFHVGDKVRLLIQYDGMITGEVVEDRGPLGIGGQRIYGVRCRLDQWNEITTEVDEENLEAVPA
jgi:hypothetical protein